MLLELYLKEKKRKEKKQKELQVLTPRSELCPGQPGTELSLVSGADTPDLVSKTPALCTFTIFLPALSSRGLAQ